MGPITLFDKSFLQSLSVDESAFFDNFFFAVTCPLFFIETLADLEKAVRLGRTPEQEVGIIATKVPEVTGAMSQHHSRIAVGNLMGLEVPMDGRVFVASGRPVTFEGNLGIVYDPPPEAEAFNRWQKGEFLEVERRYARIWRENLNSIDLLAVAAGMRAMGMDQQVCKSLDDAKSIAEAFIRRREHVPDQIRLALLLLGAPAEMQPVAVERWRNSGSPSLADYAPYSAYVLTVDIFFHVALGAGLLGASRPSNRIDIAYLYYLPFCHIFVSWDKLHRRCAPVFLRPDQNFIWGDDLKSDLAKLVERYSKLSEEEKEQGIMWFARRPPIDDADCLVAKCWDRHLRKGWREQPLGPPIGRDPVADAKVVELLNRFSKAPTMPPGEVNVDPTDAGMVQVERRVHKHKGSFWQIPKHVADKKDR